MLEHRYRVRHQRQEARVLQRILLHRQELSHQELKQAVPQVHHDQAKSSVKEPSQLSEESQEQALPPTPKQGEQVAVVGEAIRTKQPTVTPEEQSRLSMEEEAEAERRRRRREKRERKTGKEGSEKKPRHEEVDTRSEPPTDAGSHTGVQQGSMRPPPLPPPVDAPPASRRSQEPTMQPRRPLTTPPPPTSDLSVEQQRTGSSSQPVRRGRWGGNRQKNQRGFNHLLSQLTG